MTADQPSGRPEPDGGAPSEETAAEVGAMVAEQVRRAIESAERSAEDLRRQALDRASADRESVHRLAALVIDRIDDVEANVGKLLQTLRDEVARTADEVDHTEVARKAQPESHHGGRDAPEAADSPPVQPTVADARAAPAASPPVQSAVPDAPTPPATPQPPAAARRARRGLFGRRLLPECAVCGRAPRPGEEALQAWHRTGKLSLCPQCQDEGWQLPAGARVPYRPTRRDGS
jgi:hypothetical protein